jgi:hypothetical protein
MKIYKLKQMSFLDKSPIKKIGSQYYVRLQEYGTGQEFICLTSGNKKFSLMNGHFVTCDLDFRVSERIDGSLLQEVEAKNVRIID